MVKGNHKKLEAITRLRPQRQEDVLLGFRRASAVEEKRANRNNGLSEKNTANGKTLAQREEAGGVSTLTFLFYSVVLCQSLRLAEPSSSQKADCGDFACRSLNSETRGRERWRVKKRKIEFLAHFVSL